MTDDHERRRIALLRIAQRLARTDLRRFDALGAEAKEWALGEQRDRLKALRKKTKRRKAKK